MSAPDYVELHARSAFSFHRGASAPEQLIRTAASLDLPALAILDRNGVYSAPRAYQKGQEHGIRSIVGAELTMDDQSVLPLLVQTRQGYQNLCRLITRSQLRSPKGESQVGWSELEEFQEGLICLTGDEEGALRQLIAQRDLPKAQATLEKLIGIFGHDRVYVEIQRHHLRGENRIITQQLALARSLKLPIIATNGVLYATEQGRTVLDVFTCLRNHTHLDAADGLLTQNAERYLKSPTSMQQLFADLPEAIQNTRILADRLEFGLENLGYRFPNYPVAANDSMGAKLHRESFEGAKRRYGTVTPKIKKQLDHELSVINRLGFEGYFLIVWDLVRFANDNDILVQGRGSAANSAVCYTLGITAVDPIGSKLLFERFLSESRKSWPDIDLDLPSGDRRESMIQEVYRRYSPNGAAMTANVITYRGRSAMREIGKSLNLPNDVLDRFSNLFSSGDFPDTLAFQEQLARAGLPKEHPRMSSVISLYQDIYGLPRHLGQHSGGMIICNHGLDSVVPLENASMPGRVVVQWDKDDCEDLGIIKIDLLGLGMMAAIQDCLTTCQQRGQDRAIDLVNIPIDDRATFDMMERADTIGVFQIESRAQMATLPRMKPRTLYDVAIEVAIIRPGPIAGNLTHPYLDRRAGLKPIKYMHPDLKPVLERTLGVPLFQEQALQIAMIMADFSGAEADELRRALSFHRSEERLDKIVIKLQRALDAKNVSPPVQEEITNSIRSFALYGFPESHAISFALLAYASSWLKVHRAAEFYASLLNNQPMGFYSADTLIKDAKRHGIQVHPVCVIKSDWLTTIVSDHAIRLGLNRVRGLSHHTAERILIERNKDEWKHLVDFLNRTQIKKDERRILAEIGALKEFTQHRRDALWQVENPISQDDLFSENTPQSNEKESILEAMNPVERMEADYRGLHLSTGPHPMALIRKQIPNAWTANMLEEAPAGTLITIAGLIICRQRPGTANGNLFLSLEDETGISNAFVPAKTFEMNRLQITQENFLQVTGIVQKSRGVISILAKSFEPLPHATLEGNLSHDFH
jgi:error-prone DNA polymerase